LAITTTKSDSFRVDPDKVEFEEGFNVRVPDQSLQDHIDRLEDAMREGAYVPPIDVRFDEEKTFVVEGHCRIIAGRRVKQDFPDFTLEARKFRGNEQDRVLHMLGTGSGQKTLSPLEQGIGYLRLVRFGMKSADIGKKLGISRVSVDNGLALAEASPEVQELIRAGTVSSTTALQAVKKGKKAVTALKEAAKKAPATTKAGKASTKKAVTAKSLKGTDAEKKPKKAKKDAPAGETPVAPAADEITLTLKKADALAISEFIRANAPDEATALKDFASKLEMLLM